MGIVANSEVEVKERICQVTKKPMAELANALGVAWSGGCNSFVGEGMDRTSEGWQARYDGCGGYRSMDRLFLKYSDWRIELKEVVLLDRPVYTEMTPQDFPIVLDNYTTSTPFRRTKKLSVKRVAEVTDTKTTSFSFGQEFSASFGVKPPSATGGPDVSKGFKISFGQNITNGHQQRSSTEVTEEEIIDREVPPYTRSKGLLRVAQVQASQYYSAIFRVTFAIRIGGFLKWGGNDRNSPDTNYHKDFAGTDRRPWVDQYTWGKFGSDKKTFALDLREKSQGNNNPWEWERLFRQHPEARRAVDFLTDESNYEFELKGRLDNLSGTDVLVKFYDEERNPQYLREIEDYHRRHAKLAEVAPEALVASTMPAYLNQEMEI